MIDLNGKKILITGANRGIGHELAKQLAAKGAKLLLVTRTSESLDKIHQEFGDNHLYYQCDLAVSEQIKELINKIEQQNDELFALVNNAGIGVYKNLEDIGQFEWQASLDTNLSAPFFLIQGLLELMKRTDNSRVVNIGSGAGTMGMKGRSAYVASKFALRGLSLSLVDEADGRCPHISLITLGSTLTGFGGKPLEGKQQLARSGRAYFPVEFVAVKLIEILSQEKPEAEYILYPSEFGFGEWKKPS